MVRNYKKKTNRGEILPEVFEKAYSSYIKGSLSLREAAKSYGIDKMTFHRYTKKKKLENEKMKLKLVILNIGRS